MKYVPCSNAVRKLLKGSFFRADEEICCFVTERENIHIKKNITTDHHMQRRPTGKNGATTTRKGGQGTPVPP